eukprot:350850-Chlamydomonas_euryale.AAC.6
MVSADLGSSDWRWSQCDWRWSQCDWRWSQCDSANSAWEEGGKQGESSSRRSTERYTWQQSLSQRTNRHCASQVCIKRRMLDEDVRAGSGGLMGGQLSGNQWYVQQAMRAVNQVGVGSRCGAGCGPIRRWGDVLCAAWKVGGRRAT